MAEEDCGTCRFFRKNAYQNRRGECRRYPPKLFEMPEIASSTQQSYPIMPIAEWCGEFRFSDEFIDLIANYKPNTNQSN